MHNYTNSWAERIVTGSWEFGNNTQMSVHNLEIESIGSSSKILLN